MHPFDTLLEKAKAAHFHWTWNNPQPQQIEAIDVAIAILSGINKQEKPKKPEKTYYYGG